METNALLKAIHGIQTIESVMFLLKTDKPKATAYIHQLRKQGYVKTTRQSDMTRVYHISRENKLPGTAYEEIINKESPIKLVSSNIYKIYGKEPSREETIINAIESRSLRKILASLALFKKADDWKTLHRLSKEKGILRQVGALYDLSRRIMKTHRISKTFMRHALPREGTDYEYIIQGLRSKHFGDIEQRWKVYIPFNWQDLEDYKTVKSPRLPPTIDRWHTMYQKMHEAK
jgi:hypothetical protein